MAPSIGCLPTTPVRALAQRSENDSCHGWDCLGEAAQFGIILVIFAFVVALGYLYWRFQIKRAYPIGRNGRHSEDSYEVEITGQTSDTVSVTIYPVQRPPESHGDDERRRLQQRRRNVKDAGTQHEESMLPAPVQIEDLRPPEIHLVPPPPPPPALWAAAYPVVTPPSGFGPPFLSTAQPPPGLVHQEALRDSPPAVLYPQYAPPPRGSVLTIQGREQAQIDVDPVPNATQCQTVVLRLVGETRTLGGVPHLIAHGRMAMDIPVLAGGARTPHLMTPSGEFLAGW
ncbi:hypothetical protein N656DRAFT_796792 [Canariomyces notabilis]|uniref:Uncharacterized protein n=1 Tax=Canariomyces notabilis TaxID=2074819 RepID=A0AAN6THN8_9PEZI|nr:hypothetical protein N656DRAFT_796792 [Canariomyces arenarius]